MTILIKYQACHRSLGLYPKTKPHVHQCTCNMGEFQINLGQIVVVMVDH